MEENTPNMTVSPCGTQKRNDILLIAVLLVIVLAFGACLLLFRTEGNAVVVLVDGQVYGEYALTKNQTVEIITQWGENLLVIQDGKAYVSEASCPDGICARHRAVSFAGQSILCKPHRVAIEIHSKDVQQPDIII